MSVVATNAEPVSRFYTSQSLKLHYNDWGNERAPLLLLVHGMRDHARCWDWVALALRDRWHVVAPDLRGHGDSQWSPDGAYINPYHAFDVTELIDSLGHGQVTIVGHSFGGNVCARYAAIYPERVRRLVLVDALGPSDDMMSGWATEPVKRTRDWIEKRRGVMARAARRFPDLEEAVARMGDANPHLTAEQVRHLAIHGVRRFDDGYGWKYDPQLSIFMPEDFLLDGKMFWREITAPTLLCWGPESWTINPETSGRAAAFRQHRTQVFEGAGHWLHHDRLDDFLSTLNEFL